MAGYCPSQIMPDEIYPSGFLNGFQDFVRVAVMLLRRLRRWKNGHYMRIWYPITLVQNRLGPLICRRVCSLEIGKKGLGRASEAVSRAFWTPRLLAHFGQHFQGGNLILARISRPLFSMVYPVPNGVPRYLGQQWYPIGSCRPDSSQEGF